MGASAATRQSYTPPHSRFAYPLAFPDDLQAHVEDVRDREQLRLSNSRDGIHGAHRYVKRVFVAFVRQAIEAQRRGIWSPIHARSVVEAFLREQLVTEAHRLAFRGPRLPPLDVKALAATILQDGTIWALYLKTRGPRLTKKGVEVRTKFPGASASQPGVDGVKAGVLTLRVPTDADALPTAAQRRAAVDAYIREVLEKTDQTITRKDIWTAARYRTRSEFERWQRCASNVTKGAHERFMRILIEKPNLKMRRK